MIHALGKFFRSRPKDAAILLGAYSLVTALTLAIDLYSSSGDRFHWYLHFLIVFCAVTILFLLWIKRLLAATEPRLSIGSLAGILATGIALIFLGLWLSSHPSAYDWPATDMGPFFERAFDAQFAPTDFFTNASSQPNPRFAFGYVVLWLTWITGLSWYQVFFALKALFVLTLPVLFYLILATVVRRELSSPARVRFGLYLAALAVLLLTDSRINALFSIGWWTPWFSQATPQTLALWLGLIYVLAHLSPRHYVWRLPFLVAAVIIHPAIGAFCFIFGELLYGRLDWHRQGINFLTVSLSVLGAGMMWPERTSLSAAEFIRHYVVENHPDHYLVSSLGSFTSFPWWVSFGLLSGGLLGLALAGLRSKDRFLIWLGAGSAAAYGGAVLVQCLFIEVWPIKAAAVLGPIRFSQFGYWLLSAGLIYLLCRLLSPSLIKDEPAAIFRFPRWPAGVLILAFVVALFFTDDPFAAGRLARPGLADWLSANTRTDDVFAVPPAFPATDLPLLFHRAVFFGNGFPFGEEHFAEHSRRQALVYGSAAERAKVPGPSYYGAAAFYASLTPAQAKKAASAFRLDYLVTAGQNPAWAGYRPVFDNGQIKIYSLKDL